MHVTIFGSDIKVATEQHRSIGVVTLVEEAAQLCHPFQLELIFFRTNHLPVGNVDVYDAHTGDVCREQTRLAGGIVIRIAALDAGAPCSGNNRHAVVTLLAKHDAVIAERLYFEQWELIIRAFCLLNAQNIGLLGLEPTRDVREPRQNRVHIPGSDFHRLSNCLHIAAVLSTSVELPFGVPPSGGPYHSNSGPPKGGTPNMSSNLQGGD